MRPALRALSFLLPGRAKGFWVDELAAARAWLADGLAARDDCESAGWRGSQGATARL